MSLKLIVALDFDNKEQALVLVEQLDPANCALKVGNEMFTRFGPDFVKSLIRKGFKVFLDLKFHDIPNTVAKACKSAADMGVWMTNVHASGGERMLSAAREAIECFGQDRPVLIAVTVLTSFSSLELPSIGIKNSLIDQVNQLALLSQRSGLDGVVCSPHEVSQIKGSCGANFLTVTPGVRMADDQSNDQIRIMTPKQAIEAGSDFLVIGRPITRATHPGEKLRQILQDIE